YMVSHFPNEEETNSFLVNQLQYGAMCEIQGIIELPGEARNPGQFDYHQYLLTKNIFYQIILDDLEDIQCEGSVFWQRFFTLRLKLIQQAPNKLSDHTAMWLNALVLGDKSKIEESVIDLF